MATTLLNKKISESFPEPIAKAWYEMRCASSDTGRCLGAITVAGAMIRTLLAIALADLHSNPRAVEPEDWASIEQFILPLKKPASGHYGQLLGHVCRVLRKRGAPFCEELDDFANGREGADLLLKLVQLRNFDVHPRPAFSDREWSDHWIQWEQRIGAVAEKLNFLTQYRFFRVVRNEPLERRRQDDRLYALSLAYFTGHGAYKPPPEEGSYNWGVEWTHGPNAVAALSPDGRDVLLLTPFAVYQRPSFRRSARVMSRLSTPLEEIERLMLFEALTPAEVVYTGDVDRLVLEARVSGPSSESRTFEAWWKSDDLETRHVNGSPEHLALPRQAPRSGLVGGRYEPREEIGRGNFGRVFRAIDTNMQERQVALKIAHVQGGTPRDIDREIRAGKELQGHPNIVTILDAGNDAGTCFLVMDLVDGPDLKSAQPGDDEDRPLRWGRDLCTALAFAHAKGIVHRDVKPANLLLSPADGRVLLTDFGLARLNGSSSLGVVGALDYVSPELLLNSTVVMPSTDIYSAGVVVHQLVTGQLPLYEEGTPRRLGGKEVDGPVGELLRRMTMKEPEKRPTATEASQALETILMNRRMERLKAEETARQSKAEADRLAAETERVAREELARAEADEARRQLDAASAEQARVAREQERVARDEAERKARADLEESSRQKEVEHHQAAFESQAARPAPVSAQQVESARTANARAVAPSEPAWVERGSQEQQDTVNRIRGGLLLLLCVTVVWAFFVLQTERAPTVAARPADPPTSVPSPAPAPPPTRYCKLGDAQACYAEGWNQLSINASQALKQFEAACKDGHTDACRQTAKMYVEGTGVAKDLDGGVTLYDWTCEQKNNSNACNDLATMYAGGAIPGLPKGEVHAAALFARSCNLGDPKGCERQGRMIEKGFDGQKGDAVLAKALYNQASAAGNADAYDDIGRMLLRSGQVKDAQADFDKSCKAKDWDGCNDLGRMLQSSGDADAARQAGVLYDQSCHAGQNWDGCNNLARMYELGLGGYAKDEKEAQSRYDESCHAGKNSDGCNNLARMYALGVAGEAKNEPEAQSLYDKSCKAGNLEACNGLGRMLEQGRDGQEKDLAQAGALYERSCKAENWDGCNERARMLEQGLLGNADPAQAEALYRQSCHAGNGEGCDNLGRMLERGLVGNKKYEKRARADYEKSCDLGNAAGCAHLGLMYENGWEGHVKDEGRAVSFFGRACDAGYAPGCMAGGMAYKTGWETRGKDEVQAGAWFKKACDAGDGLGCDFAGAAYELGENGLAKDEAQAIAFYDRGCKAAQGKGCFLLGGVYNRRGGPNDPAAAKAAFDRACALGILNACPKDDKK